MGDLVHLVVMDSLVLLDKRAKPAVRESQLLDRPRRRARKENQADQDCQDRMDKLAGRARPANLDQKVHLDYLAILAYRVNPVNQVNRDLLDQRVSRVSMDFPDRLVLRE